MKELTEVKPGDEDRIISSLQDFIVGKDHPCVMAQSVFSQNQADIHIYAGLGTVATARKILQDLRSYLDRYDFESNDFFSFIATFIEQKEMTEQEFEHKLWKQLQYIHEQDESPWDSQVSDDPQSSNFSFSILGKAFYIVGMHPGSSRMARQSPFPVMVFNLHWQFERLREMGAYSAVRDKIRERDVQLQGTVNPMLEDFGQKSEALQYSGRAVGEEWKCPFHKK